MSDVSDVRVVEAGTSEHLLLSFPAELVLAPDQAGEGLARAVGGAGRAQNGQRLRVALTTAAAQNSLVR
jgi:hypothetical protein